MSVPSQEMNLKLGKWYRVEIPGVKHNEMLELQFLSVEGTILLFKDKTGATIRTTGVLSIEAIDCR